MLGPNPANYATARFSNTPPQLESHANEIGRDMPPSTTIHATTVSPESFPGLTESSNANCGMVGERIKRSQLRSIGGASAYSVEALASNPLEPEALLQKRNRLEN